MIVDLHMHTSCSDGVYTPVQLTRMAAEAKLSVMAISDHDTVSAYDGSWTFDTAVRVIPAIEMSTECNGEDVHVLGYYIDPAAPPLVDYCQRFEARRRSRALEIVDRCISLGYDIDRHQVEMLLEKEGTVGRPHIARMLIEKGYYKDVHTVFNELLYRGGPAYVPYKRCTIRECIDLIHQAGGLAVLAHPGLVKKNLATVLTNPFDGLEVFHPDNRGREAEFTALARERNWYISGGSDFHGVAARFPEKVGIYTFDTALLQPLLEYR